jgi:Protein of unknown function (DUF3617)
MGSAVSFLQGQFLSAQKGTDRMTRLCSLAISNAVRGEATASVARNETIRRARGSLSGTASREMRIQRNLRHPFVIFLAAGMSISLGLVQRADAAPKPGLWKVVTHISRNGANSPPDTHTSCVTAEQMKDPGRTIMPQQSSADEKCNRTHYEWTGSKLSWQIQCTGPLTMKGGGNILFDTPEHYIGKITSVGSIRGQGFTSTILLEGQRVGDCPK